MRVFAAIELPADVRDALAEVHRKIRPLSQSARWVAPESIHLTLKFLGEVPESRIVMIDEALINLAWKPFTVSVKGVGFFPGARSPRVFWAGLEAPRMAELAIEIDARLERIGFEKEKRAFRPHITLARAKESRMEASLVAAAAGLEEREFGSFVVDRFFLFQSTLKPSGAIYTKLKEYTLQR
jgi:2'-5' RNA ligase